MDHDADAAAASAAGSVEPLRGFVGTAEFGARIPEPLDGIAPKLGIAPFPIIEPSVAWCPAISPGELAPKLNTERNAPAAQRVKASKSRGAKKPD